MAHTSIWDMSTTAASNTSVQGTNIGEGCAPSGINDGMRAMIAQTVGALLSVTASGTDTYTATLAPAPDALTDGMTIQVRFTNANATTTPTLNINSLGAKTIVKEGGAALVASDIPAGHDAILRYVSGSTEWQLLNPLSAFVVGDLSTKSAPTTSDSAVIMDAAASNAAKTATLASVLALFRGYLAGLTLSRNGTTPNTKIDVSEGVAVDSTNAALISLAALTIDTSGTGAGGLDTGTLAASTWYHAWVIAKTDGTSSAILSTSSTAPTMPSGYTLKRRIGSVKTDGSTHFLAFTQLGDEFLWATPVKDLDTNTAGTTSSAQALASLPTGIKITALIRGVLSSSTVGVDALISSPDDGSSASNTPSGNMNIGTVQVASGIVNFELRVGTNTSAQVNVVASASSTTLRIVTYGWVDRRGRDD